MATFCERAAHPGKPFVLFVLFVIYVVANLGFEGGTVVLIVQVSGLGYLLLSPNS